MARRVVRFVARVECGGLCRDGHREQQQDEQRPPEQRETPRDPDSAAAK
jgi:hypothetical protein